MTPPLRSALYSIKQSQAKRRKIIAELVALFANIQIANTDAMSTNALTQAFGWTEENLVYQQDVSELNRLLLDAIEQSLKGSEQENLIQELYKGSMEQKIICSECKYESTRIEHFMDITLSVEGLSNLNDSFKQYLSPEVLEKENQYRCPICEKKVNAEKILFITQPPKILTFTLNRFRYNWKKQEREKLQTPFEFPFQLDLSNFSHQNGQYSLFSVIIHRGSANGGHYFAYIKDTTNQGFWDLNSKRAHDSKAGFDIICKPDQEPLSFIIEILSKEEPFTTIYSSDYCW
jgi:uncharacterized UBP type Zn finger protein